MANDFFTVSGTPSTGSGLTSAPIRGEFTAIQTGFDKMPLLVSNASKPVFVNAAANALETQTLDAARTSLGIDVNNGLSNKLINGDFDIVQRNITQTASGYGSFDRWSYEIAGSTQVVSRQSHTLGASLVNKSTFFSRVVVTSVANAANYCLQNQRIENVRSYAGKTVTVSFIAKADAVKNIAIEFAQVFGTGGSPSAVVTAIGSQKIALTTTFARYTASIAIPGISGKTLGTAGNDYLQFTIWFDAGSTFNARTATLGQQSGTFDIGQMQIQEGTLASPFDYRPIGLELFLCERYYETSYNVGVVPGTATSIGAPGFRLVNAGTSTIARIPIFFKVMKRATPTVTTYSVNSGTAGQIYDVTGAVDVAATNFNIGISGYLAQATVTAKTDINLNCQYTSESEL